MAFEGLTQRLQQAFGKVRGKGSLTEEDVKTGDARGAHGACWRPTSTTWLSRTS